LAIERLIITGGGTGGHLYPGLAVAKELKRRNPACRIAFIGIKKGLEAKIVPQEGFELFLVSSTPPRGLFWPLKNAWGLLQSLAVLSKFSPQLVLGSGGYISVPAVAASALLRIPVVLMEQNVIPGKASRFLGRFADKICLSFAQSAWGTEQNKFIVTGNPIRAEILLAKKQESRNIMGINQDRKCLLVTGASQGAKSINRAVLKALPGWKNYPWEVIHLTGSKDFNLVKESAPALLEGGVLNFRPIEYLADMPSAYAAADLVVSRAGATTLAEITARGLPAVLVPYPYAQAHQAANAQWLADRGGAVVLADDQVENALEAKVIELFEDSEQLKNMGEASHKAGQPNAANDVLMEMEQAVERRMK